MEEQLGGRGNLPDRIYSIYLLRGAKFTPALCSVRATSRPRRRGLWCLPSATGGAIAAWRSVPLAVALARGYSSLWAVPCSVHKRGTLWAWHVPRATVDVGAPRARKGPGRLCTSAFRREWCAQAPPRGCTALPAWNRGGIRDVSGCCRASTVRVARRVRELQALSRQTQTALRSYIATQWFEAAVAARTAVVQRAALR